jgi:hypothetical protein
MLNELRAALLASAHHRRTLARHLPRYAPGLITQAGQREHWGNALAAFIRASGDLPDTPDPEREIAGELALRMRQLLEGEQAAMSALAQEDDHLLMLSKRTRAQTLPEEAQALLDEMEQALS